MFAPLSELHKRLIFIRNCKLILFAALACALIVATLFLRVEVGIIYLLLVVAAVIAATTLVVRPYLRKPVLQQAASILDHRLDLKERTLTLTELVQDGTHGEWGEAKRNLLIQQLDELSSTVNLRSLAPFTFSYIEQIFVVTSGAFIIALLYSILSSTPSTRGVARVEAEKLAEIIAQHPELSPEIKEKVLTLSDELDRNDLLSPAVPELIESVRDSLQATEGGDNGADKSDTADSRDSQKSEGLGKQDRASEESPIPSVTSTPTPEARKEQAGPTPSPTPQKDEARTEKLSPGQEPPDIQSSKSSKDQEGADKAPQSKAGDESDASQTGAKGEKGPQDQAGQKKSGAQGGDGEGEKGDKGGSSSAKESSEQGKSGSNGQKAEGKEGSEQQGEKEGRGQDSKEQGKSGESGGSDGGAGSNSDSGDAKQGKSGAESSLKDAIERIEKAVEKEKKEQSQDKNGKEQGENGTGSQGGGEKQSSEGKQGNEQKSGDGKGAGKEEERRNESNAGKGGGESPKPDSSGKTGSAGKPGQEKNIGGEIERQPSDPVKPDLEKKESEGPGSPPKGEEQDARAPEGGAPSDDQSKEEDQKQSLTNTPRPQQIPTSGSEAKRFGDGEGGSDGLAGKAKEFKDVAIPGSDEKLDSRYTSDTGESVRHEGEGKYRTTLEDLKLSKPAPPNSDERQEVPLEYRDLLR